jgi:hypothetical protein
MNTSGLGTPHKFNLESSPVPVQLDMVKSNEFIIRALFPG